ncbi:fic family toxin-antitoxin system, toxin component [Streptomyces sp. NBC_01314]|uniref:fic family toxin-antitoxin system, toxin component n=1 Tax=Streptomyces sp. NBC_01314 TaxID=2903821 RepID=UPI003085D7E3|nr:fic family toxin-antitoxin system, toxin component [Streptomyces sp. NBC_01314]
MNVDIDLAWILEVAQRAGQDDPAIDDYGVAIATVERHRAVLVGQDVYQGAYAKAAALAHSLGRMRWLERSNLRVAVAVAHAYLIASGAPAKLDQRRVSALATELKKESCTAGSVAEVLRSWAV